MGRKWVVHVLRWMCDLILWKHLLRLPLVMLVTHIRCLATILLDPKRDYVSVPFADMVNHITSSASLYQFIHKDFFTKLRKWSYISVSALQTFISSVLLCFVVSLLVELADGTSELHVLPYGLAIESGADIKAGHELYISYTRQSTLLIWLFYFLCFNAPFFVFCFLFCCFVVSSFPFSLSDHLFIPEFVLLNVLMLWCLAPWSNSNNMGLLLQYGFIEPDHALDYFVIGMEETEDPALRHKSTVCVVQFSSVQLSSVQLQ